MTEQTRLVSSEIDVKNLAMATVDSVMREQSPCGPIDMAIGEMFNDLNTRLKELISRSEQSGYRISSIGLLWRCGCDEEGNLKPEGDRRRIEIKLNRRPDPSESMNDLLHQIRDHLASIDAERKAQREHEEREKAFELAKKQAAFSDAQAMLAREMAKGAQENRELVNQFNAFPIPETTCKPDPKNPADYQGHHQQSVDVIPNFKHFDVIFPDDKRYPPSDIIDAAYKLRAWMESQTPGATICGLRLAPDETIYFGYR